MMAILALPLAGDLFPDIQPHFTQTKDGADNHYYGLVKIITQKYFSLRIKKTLKDHNVNSKIQDGNKLHRLRIFQNL